MCIDDDKAKRNREEKEAKEEDGARGLPESKAVLDNADAVLAVGARRRRDEDGRSAVDRFVSARARGVDGAVEQYGFEPGAPESYAGGAVVTTHWDSRQVAGVYTCERFFYRGFC